MGRPVDPRRTEDGTGKPFIVREAHPDDATALLSHTRQVMREGLPGIITRPDEFDMTVAQERTFINRHRRDETDGLFVAVRPRGKTVLGVIRGQAPSRLRVRHTWTLGVTVGKRWRGLGIGRALIEFAIDYVRDHPQLAKIALTVMEDNEGAVKLYHDLGFRLEGRRIKGLRREDGRFVDELLMYRWLGNLDE